MNKIPKSGYAINGLYLTVDNLGITRYARELMFEFDKIIEFGDYIVVTPASCSDVPYENIVQVRFGSLRGVAWEQIDFAHYCRRNGLKSLNLCNTLPLLCPWGVTAIHDISYKVNREFFPGVRGELSCLWHRLNYWRAFNSCEAIITVSEFSKSDFVRVYRVNPSRIHVVYDAWQHMERVRADNAIIERLGLRLGGYYFTLSSLAPNKNIGWIIESARLTPEKAFVIGGTSRIREAFRDVIPPNVVFTGHLEDAEVKALMVGCAAFLFPTFYEGFGMPPLEALACGVPIVVSDTPTMREIYGDAACYVNPYVPVCIESIEADRSEGSRRECLHRFSWGRSARSLSRIMR